jgi:ABC-2 type transport system ATP-binding protein
MIESVPIIENMTAGDYLMFIGLLYELPKNIALQRIKDLLTFFFEGENILNKNIGVFSTGMKKKIAICASLINNPKLLIWDEPFSGLDPVSAQKVVDFINFYTSDEKIILIASHDLAYVDQVATHLGILDNGQMIYDGLYTDFTDGKSIGSSIKDYLQFEPINTSTFSWMTA